MKTNTFQTSDAIVKMTYRTDEHQWSSVHNRQPILIRWMPTVCLCLKQYFQGGIPSLSEPTKHPPWICSCFARTEPRHSKKRNSCVFHEMIKMKIYTMIPLAMMIPKNCQSMVARTWRSTKSNSSTHSSNHTHTTRCLIRRIEVRQGIQLGGAVLIRRFWEWIEVRQRN